MRRNAKGKSIAGRDGTEVTIEEIEIEIRRGMEERLTHEEEEIEIIDVLGAADLTIKAKIEAEKDQIIGET